MGLGTCETCEFEESGCSVSRKGGECSNMWQPKKHEIGDAEKMVVLCLECPLSGENGDCERDDVTLIAGRCQSYLGVAKLSPYMPAHGNYDDDSCCGIFMNIKGGTVVCNECGMELVELMDSLAAKTKKITPDFLRSIHWIGTEDGTRKRPMSHIITEKELEWLVIAINEYRKGE